MHPEEKSKLSPALKYKSPGYPVRFEGQVPKMVQMTKTVYSDIPLPGMPYARCGEVHWVSVNSHGAVTVLFSENKELGVKSDEFEVVEYHKTMEPESISDVEFETGKG